MGKKKTTRQREALLENLRDGLTIKSACAQAGIGRSTFYKWLAESGKKGEWSKEVEAAESLGEIAALENMKMCIDEKRDWKGWAWFLERRYKEEWGPKREVDINVHNPSQQANEMVLKMIEQSNQAYAAPQVEESENEPES